MGDSSEDLEQFFTSEYEKLSLNEDENINEDEDFDEFFRANSSWLESGESDGSDIDIEEFFHDENQKSSKLSEQKMPDIEIKQKANTSPLIERPNNEPLKDTSVNDTLKYLIFLQNHFISQEQRIDEIHQALKQDGQNISHQMLPSNLVLSNI